MLVSHDTALPIDSLKASILRAIIANTILLLAKCALNLKDEVYESKFAEGGKQEIAFRHGF